jgi:predicted metal-dependent hydrolase
MLLKASHSNGLRQQTVKRRIKSEQQRRTAMPKQPNLKIYRQNRQNLMMRAVPGAIEVYIPYQLDETHRLVQDFIKKGLAQIGNKLPAIPSEKTSREAIEAMFYDYALRLNVKASRVQFRDMRRKWGSCSSKGTITLNTRLTWLEPDLAEYIVCHELAHLIELNHSKAYWAIVEKQMPDYKARIKRLRAAEKTLW